MAHLLLLIALGRGELRHPARLADRAVVVRPARAISHLCRCRRLPLLRWHDGLGLILSVLFEGEHASRGHVRGVEDEGNARPEVVPLHAGKWRVHADGGVEMANEILARVSRGGNGLRPSHRELRPCLTELVTHPVAELVAPSTTVLHGNRRRRRRLLLLRILCVGALYDVVVRLEARDLPEEANCLESAIAGELEHGRAEDVAIALHEPQARFAEVVELINNIWDLRVLRVFGLGLRTRRWAPSSSATGG